MSPHSVIITNILSDVLSEFILMDILSLLPLKTIFEVNLQLQIKLVIVLKWRNEIGKRSNFHLKFLYCLNVYDKQLLFVKANEFLVNEFVVFVTQPLNAKNKWNKILKQCSPHKAKIWLLDALLCFMAMICFRYSANTDYYYIPKYVHRNVTIVHIWLYF